MNLQELIDQTNLDLNESQIKAFFLGALAADTPLPYKKALEELVSGEIEAMASLEGPLSEVWDNLQENKGKELEKLLPTIDNLQEFLSVANDQLDYFLTSLSLAGTNTEQCKNKDLVEVLEELEDLVLDVEDFLADPDSGDGNELKESLLNVWSDFLDIQG